MKAIPYDQPRRAPTRKLTAALLGAAGAQLLVMLVPALDDAPAFVEVLEVIFVLGVSGVAGYFRRDAVRVP